MWENPKRVEAAVKRLTREIDEIDAYFYGTNEKDDRVLYAGILERKRDDMVRSVVLQIHTAIEDLLDQHIAFALTGATLRRPARSHSARALRSILIGGAGIGFDRKIALAHGAADYQQENQRPTPDPQQRAQQMQPQLDFEPIGDDGDVFGKFNRHQPHRPALFK